MRVEITLIAFIPILLRCSNISALKMEMKPENTPVWLGDQVYFLCQPQRSQNRRFPLVIKGPTRILSEKCMVYDSSRYELRCDPPGWEMAERFYFTIRNVSWTDRGSWNCMHSDNKTERKLEVYVPGQIQTFSVELVEQKRLHYSTEVSEVASYSLLPSSIPLEGAGIKEFPLRLRTKPVNFVLKIRCRISCSYPVTAIHWIASNKTNNLTLTSDNSTQQNSVHSCNGDTSTEGMSWTEEVIYVNCLTFSLTGRTQVSCRASGVQYDNRPSVMASSSQSVHFVCPSPLQPTVLTNGEVAAIGVSCVLACLLLFLAGVIVREHQKKSSPNESSLYIGYNNTSNYPTYQSSYRSIHL